MAARDETKQFCAIEFGLGNYDAEAFVVLTHTAWGTNPVTFPTSTWPAPNEGIAIFVGAATCDPNPCDELESTYDATWGAIKQFYR